MRDGASELVTHSDKLDLSRKDLLRHRRSIRAVSEKPQQVELRLDSSSTVFSAISTTVHTNKPVTGGRKTKKAVAAGFEDPLCTSFFYPHVERTCLISLNRLLRVPQLHVRRRQVVVGVAEPRLQLDRLQEE